MLTTGKFAQVKWLVSGDIDPLDYGNLDDLWWR